MKRDLLNCLMLFAAALLARWIAASLLVFPQLDDPAGYIQLARNLASGRGFISDVLWSYWVSFPSVTHPSNEFWMPLASVVMAGSIRLLGDTLFAAQLPGIIAGALLVPLAYGMGRTLWPAQRRWAVLAAALLVPSAALLYQSVSADSSALYTLLATLALFVGAQAIDRERIRWAVVTGLLCGLSYLTRSHGLVVPAAIGLIALIKLRLRPRLLMAFIAALALGFFALIVPWWLRNHAVFGTTQPIPLTAIIASRGYEDWFNYTNQPTLASITHMGWDAFFGYRSDALLKALGVIVTMTFPFGLIGLPIALPYFFLFVPLLAVIVSLPISFNGIGVREGAGIVLFGLVGVSRAQAFSLQFTTYLVAVAVSLLGGVVFLARLPGRRAGARSAEETS